jgi:antitoxin component YwqK of YwqJK toxin-antitoxin module
MNIKTLIPMLACGALVLQGCNGKEETKWDNGQVHEKWTEKKGPDGQMVKDGPWQSFDEKGAKRDSVTYVMGNREGAEVLWASDGKVESECNWTANQQSGKCTTYYPNGKIKLVATMKAGIIEGEQLAFNEQGVKTEQKFIKDGRLDSIFQSWSDKGVLKHIAHYNNGIQVGEEKVWCEDGPHASVMREQRTFVAGKREGIETYYLCLDGNISSILTWKADQMDGPYTYWEEGKKIVEKYKEGKCVANCPKVPTPPKQ